MSLLLQGWGDILRKESKKKSRRMGGETTYFEMGLEVVGVYHLHSNIVVKLGMFNIVQVL